MTPLRSDFYAATNVQPEKSPPADAVPATSGDEPSPNSLSPRSLRRPGLLTTGDMARLSSNTVRTVRFYEETGVLEPAHRSEGGHRLFPTSELDKLVFISAMRDAGLSLEEIKLLLGMKSAHQNGAEASRQITEVLERHISSMTEKIAVLSRVRAEFQQAAGVLDSCRDCHDEPRFPKECAGCDVMQPGPPLAVRVLWRVAAGAPAAETPAPSTPEER